MYWFQIILFLWRKKQSRQVLNKIDWQKKGLKGSPRWKSCKIWTFVLLRQDTGYMVEKTYLDIVPYLGAFGPI